MSTGHRTGYRWVRLLLAGGLAAAAVSSARAIARNPTIIGCGLVALGSLAALVMIGAVLAAVGRRNRRAVGVGLIRDDRGTAVVEFALLFPVAMAVVLVMIQAMLMMSATVVANYAAFAAARTAIVWVPKDLSGNVPEGFDPEPENVVAAPPRSYKMFMIRSSAAHACLPISGRSSADVATARVIRDGIERYFRQLGEPTPNWVSGLVAAQFAYAWTRTRVRLDDWTDSPNTYQPRQDITVWVYHDYNLSIPFASALFAQRYTSDGYVSTITAVSTLNNEGVSDTIKEDRFD